MSELSIKVNIANRTYPLSVQREEEEEVRKAAAHINDRIRALEAGFAVKDKTDLLAMLALEMTMEKGHGRDKMANEKALETVNSLISKVQLELAHD